MDGLELLDLGSRHLEEIQEDAVQAQVALWEILVPTLRNGKPVRTKSHKVWDARIREISGGLTVLRPAKGEWVAPDGTLFSERMIPVRIMCTSDQIEEIAKITASFYDQLAVMFYKISDDCRIRHFG